MNKQYIVEPGRRDPDIFVPAFARAWPVEHAMQFSELLRLIDGADRDPRQPRTGRN